LRAHVQPRLDAGDAGKTNLTGGLERALGRGGAGAADEQPVALELADERELAIADAQPGEWQHAVLDLEAAAAGQRALVSRERGIDVERAAGDADRARVEQGPQRRER